MITGQPKEENQTHICMDKTVFLSRSSLEVVKNCETTFFSQQAITTTGYVFQGMLNFQPCFGPKIYFFLRRNFFLLGRKRGSNPRQGNLSSL